ncbi:MAG: TRAP transporter TatT component family protein [Sandaracinaceae bacterium]|nr:TRAP transporter TatT component family protein [Sandaracinaceae bacterium]
MESAKKHVLRKGVGLLLVLPWLGACGGARSSVFDEEGAALSGPVSPEAKARHDELVAKGDEAFAKRVETSELQAAIDAWSEAVRLVPNDYQTYTKLARAQYFMAYGHLEFDPAKEAAVKETYWSSVQNAERGLAAFSPEFAERVRTSGRFEAGLPVLDQRAVGLVYWRSASLGRWARRDGFATVLRYKDEIRESMRRCLELDRDYFFGGPDRYFGAFYAVAPPYAGGDLEKSKQHFEYSISRFPGYFGTHVLYAVEYAVKAQDRALFLRELQWVLDNDPNMLPEAAPENIIEQRKAREHIARVDELFE